MHAGGEVVAQVNGKGLWRLRQQSMINVAIGNPDHFAGIVVIGSQDVRYVRHLPALIYQFTFQDVAPARVSLNALMQGIAGEANLTTDYRLDAKLIMRASA